MSSPGGQARWDLWLHLLPLVVFLCVGAAFWDTLAYTEKNWRDSAAYGHGHLVVLISLYLLWKLRRPLRESRKRLRPTGLAFILAASLAWLVADVAAVQVGKQLALLLLLGACVWTLYGNEVAKKVSFPVGYLLTAIPVWSVFIPWLQTNTAEVSAWTLRLFGVPVLLEGTFITIPEGRFEIAEVCAGLRYLVATLALAALYAYITYRSLWRALVFFTGSAFISIVFNWIRVVSILMIGHLSEMQHSLVHSHIEFGWLMFALALVPIFLLGGWLQRGESTQPEPEPGPGVAGLSYRPAGVGAMTAAAVVLSCLGPAATYVMTRSAQSGGNPSFEPMAALYDWAGPTEVANPLEPRFDGADVRLSNGYSHEGRDVSLFIAYYGYQTQGRELISDSNSLYDKDYWTRLSSRSLRVAMDGAERPVVELELVSTRGDRRLLWYYYIVGEQITTSRLAGKLLQVWGALRGRHAAVAVSLSAPAEGSLETARADLEKFSVAVMPGVIAAVRPPSGGS